MAKKKDHPPARITGLDKVRTGIAGLDEITGGGLPKGRPTLVCGAAGSGKTLLAVEFLVRGALEYGEPGVFMAFEETEKELAQNCASLGFDLDAMVAQKKLAMDYVYLERREIEETGEYDLEGLFIRLAHAIDSIGAKRVALDTIETLFAGLPNPAILRAELRRLFRWLKDKGVTAVVTGERGDGSGLTRYGLEEYVADCVILLDHRVVDQIATRRLRIVKYRGSTHGTGEYPFLIDQRGISVLPITSLEMAYQVSTERISSGIPRLDTMLEGQGYYRGTSVLISGTAGSGKTSVAAHFAAAACRRGERCLWFAFEESASQIIRNMRSIGLDLEPWMKQGLLQFHAARPTLYGLEMHLLEMIRLVREYQPRAVVVDPITNFIAAGSGLEVKAMLMRLIDYFKMERTTAMFTSLTRGGSELEQTEVGVSSLMDTWLLLRDIESNGERNRGLYILKSRGMAHSNQIREFLLTERGIELVDVYAGSAGGLLTGTARAVQDAQERAGALARQQEVERRQRDLERKRHALEAQVAVLRADFEAEEETVRQLAAEYQQDETLAEQDRARLAHMRRADMPAPKDE
jgi:circadian clock protein KaiC